MAMDLGYFIQNLKVKLFFIQDGGKVLEPISYKLKTSIRP